MSTHRDIIFNHLKAKKTETPIIRVPKRPVEKYVWYDTRSRHVSRRQRGLQYEFD